MAIHSIDNQTVAPDVLDTIREGLGTTSISPIIEGQAVGKVKIKDAQIIVNDGTNDRVLIGLF
jgi:hypothetical protein